MIRGITTLWKRELTLYFRNKARVFGSLGIPFFFLVSLGFGLNSVIQTGEVNYFSFLAPGIVGMVLLFNGVFSGLALIQEKQFGFIKEMLVAPIPRSSIVLGKSLGNATTGSIQALIVLFISVFLGLNFSLINLVPAVLVMFLMSIGFVSVGLAIASKLTDPQGFQFVINFLVFPLFLFSGALFPLNDAPEIMRLIALIDPLTYGVDALRGVLIGANHFNIFVDIAAISFFAFLMVGIATILFRKTD